MRRSERLPELLSPAGDMQCLRAAVRGGADAIYVGGKNFGARAFAKNFDIDELREAVRYCHLYGVKLYVTVNTLVYDREMREVSDYVARLYEIGVDAVIVADLGVIREIKRRVPDLEIHASTQCSAHNTSGVAALFNAGCSRVVLARELPISEIRTIIENSPAEIEVFLHGALCVCHSGQCLMSSLVGGRSGNRGECAQPCRLPYGTARMSNKYPLSLSDLSLAAHIPELIDLGVKSLKIEGRMKAPEYVYEVTSVYRRLLDEGRAATRDELLRLRAAFSRGEFTDAYFVGHPERKMTGVRSELDKEKTRALGSVELDEVPVKIKAEATFRMGEPSSLTLILGERCVIVSGDVPGEAINAPLTEDGVKARLSKMGGTGLVLSPDDISLTLERGINLSPGSINALRRSAVDGLLNCDRAPVSNIYEDERIQKSESAPITTALFLNSREYSLAIGKKASALSKIDVHFLPVYDFVSGANGVYIPPVVFDGEVVEIESLASAAREMGAEYALVGNVGALEIAKRNGFVPIGDFRLNISNKGAGAYYKDRGLPYFVLSPELTLPMARDIGGGEIVYGRIPLMLTERCFIKENFGCESCGNAALTDRTGAKFPILREWKHRNIILNSRPTYMGDRKDELTRAGINHSHFIFTVENADEIARVLEAYFRGAPIGAEVRRIGKRNKERQ